MENDRLFKKNVYNIKSEKDFQKLFNEFYPSIYHYANRIIENKEVAEDIAQEVFINLWNKRNDLEIHSFSGFLYTSTRYRCMNYLRKEQVHLRKNNEFNNCSLDQIDDRLFIIEEEMVREIINLINKLPEQQQNVIKLQIAGLKQQEIAEELNISVNTVKSHKLLARQKLKKQLKNTLYILFLVKF